MDQQAVEVWKNTALGYRHIIYFDRLGHEASQVIRGESTFTITTFARQINQQRAATPSLDAFRNGTFVLVKGGAETLEDEIESSESFTDNELLSLAHDVLAKNKTVQMAILNMSSPLTLSRFREVLVLQEASMEDVNVVKAKIAEVEGGPVVRRAQVVGDGGSRMPTVPKDPEVDDEVASPGREIVPERVK